MKKIFLYSLAASAIFFTGCLKDTPNTDFSTVGTLAEIGTSNLNANLNAPSGGLDYFKQATLPSFSSSAPFDVTFDVNIASQYPPTKDINVTLALDDSKRTDYNALGGIQFEQAPDSIYSFPVKTAVIKAGTRLAQFTVTFYPDKLDIAHSYLLPITISDASGIQVSGNLGTIYLHNLGNPLAGPYIETTGGRYNYSGASGWTGTGAYPGGYSLADLTGTPKTASPESTTTVDLNFANLGGNGYQYIITYNGVQGSGAALTDVSGNFLSSVSNFTVYTKTINWNGGKPIIHIVCTYNNGANGSGNDRIIDETFTHQ